MARMPRFNLPRVPHHVIQRGNNRDPFFLGEQDYHRYPAELCAALLPNDCRLRGAVLLKR